MSKSYLTQSYVDHYLQSDVITKLAKAEKPLRFSELKDDGIENSLFMYHANKLIDRGIIAKQDDGFTLTVKGARWANYAGVLHSFQVLTPRPLIQFVIKKPDNTVLISSRRGQLKSLINQYLFPGNIHRHGINLAENATNILEDIFGKNNLEPRLLTTAEVIHRYKDGDFNHVISHIFEVTIGNDLEPNDNELYELEWFPLSEIVSTQSKFDTSPFLSQFLSLKDIGSYELFVIDL